MNLQDEIIRATAADAQIRIFTASTKNLVECARQKHNTSPVATAALGRLLTAGAMMGSMLKGDQDLLTLRIHADGPIGGIIVTADANSAVKGYVNNPNVILPANAVGKLDVAAAIGNGGLDVIKDLGLKDPYVGQTALQTGEIAEDLTYYFANSEQVPSSVGLGVLMDKSNTVSQAGGFIIQLMPFTEEDVIVQLEENLRNVSSVTSILKDNHDAKDLLEILAQGLNPVITDRIHPVFQCNCDRARVERALLSVGREEIQQMIAEGEPIEMKCQFCNASYIFEISELQRLLQT